MADYKGIKGFKVRSLSTDPIESQFAGGAWASGGSLNTTRNSASSAGTQTAMIAMGGEPDRTDTETYDGSSWTSQPSTNDDHYSGTGFGTSSAALVAGGMMDKDVELWDGSTWTTTTDMANNRYTASGSPAAPQSAGIVFGGMNTWPGEEGAVTALVESWDGSAWTEVGDLNNTRAYSSGAGTQTAALAISGFVGWTGAPPATPLAANVEAYNGTSWTEVGDLNTARHIYNASFGIQTSAVSAGGDGPSALTEVYNGTSWTEFADLATARTRGAAAGTSAAGALAGGGPPNTNATEEWSAPAAFNPLYVGQVYYNTTSNALKLTNQSISTGTWASSGNLNTGRDSQAGAGTRDAALCISGRTASATFTTNVESYNGTAWTEIADVLQQRWLHGAAGTQNAALCVSGSYPSSADWIANTEEYNGTSWSEVNDVNSARRSSGYAGTSSTAALYFAGRNPSSSALTEDWNGTSWTEVADVNTARAYNRGAGSSTDAVLVGGYDGSSNVANYETWDGTSWSEQTDINTARHGNCVSGTSTDAIVYGGDGTGKITESYNGTSWTEVADLATGRYDFAGGSCTDSNLSALAHGGPSYTNATEEWNVPIANETITVS
jgi:hypothetical protein